MMKLLTIVWRFLLEEKLIAALKHIRQGVFAKFSLQINRMFKKHQTITNKRYDFLARINGESIIKKKSTDLCWHAGTCYVIGLR